MGRWKCKILKLFHYSFLSRAFLFASRYRLFPWEGFWFVSCSSVLHISHVYFSNRLSYLLLYTFGNNFIFQLKKGSGFFFVISITPPGHLLFICFFFSLRFCCVNTPESTESGNFLVILRTSHPALCFISLLILVFSLFQS